MHNMQNVSLQIQELLSSILNQSSSGNLPQNLKCAICYSQHPANSQLTLLKLGCWHKCSTLRLTPHCHIKSTESVNLEHLSEHPNFNRVKTKNCLFWDTN